MNKIKILVISESEMLIADLKRLFQSEEVEVLEAISCKEGIESILEDEFDYALIDTSLTPISGMEIGMAVDASFLIKLVHDINPTASIVAVVGKEEKEGELKTRSLGISYLITYPFDEKEMRALLKLGEVL